MEAQMARQWNTLEKKEFDYSDNKVVVLSKVENGKGDVIDLRVHFKEETSGEWMPTKKGVSIPIKNDLHPAKNVFLEALKMAGVTRQQVLDYYDFEDVMKGEQE